MKIDGEITWTVGDFCINLASRRHFKSQSGVNGETHGGIGALFDENTETLWFSTLDFLGVLTTLWSGDLLIATYIGNASCKIGKLVRTILLILLNCSHCYYCQRGNANANHGKLRFHPLHFTP